MLEPSLVLLLCELTVHSRGYTESYRVPCVRVVARSIGWFLSAIKKRETRMANHRNGPMPGSARGQLVTKNLRQETISMTIKLGN